MKEKALRSAIPLLAVVIALTQLYQARAHDQVAWEGGGFGMFATIDAVDNRRILATPAVVISDGTALRRALSHPGNLADLAADTAAAIGGDITMTLLRLTYDGRTVSYEPIATANASP